MARFGLLIAKSSQLNKGGLNGVLVSHGGLWTPMVNSSLKVVSVLLASAKILPGSSKHLRTKLISAYIGIGELIARYYAFKYLKQFPFTLEITVITDRIATFQCIEY